MKSLFFLTLTIGLICSIIAKPSPGQSPDKTSGQLALVMQTGHFEMINRIAYSPDGRLLATGSKDSTLKLWDSDGLELRTIAGTRKEGRALVFTPDGKSLLSDGAKGKSILCDINTGEIIRSFEGYSPALSRDGKLLATRDSSFILVFQVETGEKLYELRTQTLSMNALALSPDGKLLAGPEDKGTGIWQLNTKRLLITITQAAASLSFSGDGKQLLICGTDGTVKLWDVETGVEVERFTTDQAKYEDNIFYTAAFSPDSQTVATGSLYGVQLWSPVTGEMLRDFNDETTVYRVDAVTYSPDGKFIAGGELSGAVRVWDKASGAIVRRMGTKPKEVGAISLSPDGRLLACQTRATVIYDLRAGTKLRSHPGYGRTLQFSPDGKSLVRASGKIEFFDVNSGQPLPLPTKGVSAKTQDLIAYETAFSPDGRLLIKVAGMTGKDASTVIVIDATSLQELRVLAGHTDRVQGLAFAADSKTAASGSDDNTIKVWDASTGKNIATLRGHEYGVRSLAFSPAGEVLASGGTEDSVMLWNLKEKKLVQSLATTGAVDSLAFSVDGILLAAGTSDGKIRLWRVSATEPLLTLNAHTGAVSTLLFSRDNKLLISGGRDGLTQLWQLPSGQLLATLFAPEAEDWVIVTPDGRYDGSPGGLKHLRWVGGVKSYPVETLAKRFYTPNLLASIYRPPSGAAAKP
jgi:WD40 repeat protein